jgi:hypothetical protein
MHVAFTANVGSGAVARVSEAVEKVAARLGELRLPALGVTQRHLRTRPNVLTRGPPPPYLWSYRGQSKQH